MVPITEHLFLDHCWVCETKFDANNNRHDHHVIPRAYGGTDGPQVSLCSPHHSLLHDLALKIYSKKPIKHMLTGHLGQDQRLVYLATVACNARISTEKDPNKRQVLVLTPSNDLLIKLDKLKALSSTRTSRESIIELAVNALYAKHFK